MFSPIDFYVNFILNEINEFICKKFSLNSMSVVSLIFGFIDF